MLLYRPSDIVGCGCNFCIKIIKKTQIFIWLRIERIVPFQSAYHFFWTLFFIFQFILFLSDCFCPCDNFFAGRVDLWTCVHKSAIAKKNQCACHPIGIHFIAFHFNYANFTDTLYVLIAMGDVVESMQHAFIYLLIELFLVADCNRNRICCHGWPHCGPFQQIFIFL